MIRVSLSFLNNKVIAFIAILIVAGCIAYFVGFNFSSNNPSNDPKSSAVVNEKALALDASKADDGVSLTWKVVGIDNSHGYRLLKSTKSLPSYPGSESVYLSNSGTHGYVWSIKDSKVYYFRICTVDSQKACKIYGNEIRINL